VFVLVLASIGALGVAAVMLFAAEHDRSEARIDSSTPGELT
jgi:hypothetical protein